jgi:para-aminobenzoate synthetase/4-amino-4-deoxychorismate lyase
VAEPGRTPASASRSGAKLAPAVLDGGFGQHKWLDRRLVDPPKGRREEWLIVDADATMLETARGNFFFVERGALLTAPADGRILPGVSRDRVLDLAQSLGIPVAIGDSSLSRLQDADEAFVTSSIRGAQWVSECVGVRRWPRPGRITSALCAALARCWEQDAGQPRILF